MPDKEKNSKLVITKTEGQILTTLLQDGKPVEFHLEPEEEESLLGNIYIGKVQNIVKNIQAAFIEIKSGLPCYYSLEENPEPVCTRKMNSRRLVAGDELLVQVSRENMKTKAPTVTSNLSFTGKYLVLTSGNTRIGVSGKLSLLQKRELKELLEEYRSADYGWIIRTNAPQASTEELRIEAAQLIQQYESLKERSKFRTCYSCLYQTPKNYLTQLRDTYSGRLETILTDDRDLYDSMKEFLMEYQPEDLKKLSFYEDSLLPLGKLYNLDQALKDALKERVWLKSGAYLIIQPTEALTSIDVNTGKYDGHKNQEATFLKINLEAAREIARQLRLRNISGIIIVDFINMKSPDSKKQLMDGFQGYLSKDPVKAALVDMTALELVEVTRKKVKKSLAEQVKAITEIQRK